MATNITTIKAIARLADNHDFKEVLDHLQKLYLDAVSVGAVATDMVLIGRAQGRQQVLDDFLKLARDAREIVHKRG